MDGKTIFMNISSDAVLIDTGNEYRKNISRNFVEELLGKELIMLYREEGFDNVVVLNGPGGFTNLRVGTLCLNLLNTLLENQLIFYDISKIDLYKKAHEKGFLPKYGIIYIGQKRNIWLRNFEKNEKIGQYSFIELENLKEIEDIENVFIDDVQDTEYYPKWMDKYLKYHLLLDGADILLVDYECKIKNPISVDDLNLRLLKFIAPNYMMEPSITL